MNVKEAKKILPKSDFEAFESVFNNQIQRTSPLRLKQLAKLARKLRDKYRDLAKKQGRNVQGRGTYEIDTDIQDRRIVLMEIAMDRIEEALGRYT